MNMVQWHLCTLTKLVSNICWYLISYLLVDVWYLPHSTHSWDLFEMAMYHLSCLMSQCYCCHLAHKTHLKPAYYKSVKEITIISHIFKILDYAILHFFMYHLNCIEELIEEILLKLVRNFNRFIIHRYT